MAAAARCVARDEYRPAADSPLNRIVAVALLALGLVWTVQAAGEADFDDSIYPVAAMRWVEEQGLLGQRLMTDDAWGGYVILKYWPKQKVFVDDRYDMYPRRVLEDFIDFSDADGRWREILDRNGIEVVVWPAKATIVRLMETDPGVDGGPPGRAWPSVFVRGRPPGGRPAGIGQRAGPGPSPPPTGLEEAVDGFVAGQAVPFSVVSRRAPGRRRPSPTWPAARCSPPASTSSSWPASCSAGSTAGTLDRDAPPSAAPTERPARSATASGT